MKPFFSNALLAALLAVGSANAATTTPVGYERLTVNAGFNYLGLRLESPVLYAGTVSAVTSTSVTVSGVTFSLSAGATYIVEFANTKGVTQEFLGSAATGSVLSIPGLQSSVTVGESLKVRTAPTLASVFGVNNSAGLDVGFFGPGGDIVYLPSASGFDQYYYDSGYGSWADVNGNPIDASTIAWNYSDGVIISASGAGTNNLTVSGEVKKTTTGYALIGGAFNYLSSVYPAGSTLDSAFGAALSSIDQGFFGPGGDIFYLPDGAGGFNQYYYDAGYSSWADVNGNPIDATTVSLTPGLLIFNDGPAASLVASTPSSYSSL